MTDGAKILLIVLAIILLATISIVAIADACKSTFNPDDYEIKKIYVHEGDSLSAYYWRYADTENTRLDDWVSAVEELNNRNSAMIYAGERLQVYVASN